ncbi:MAG: nuclear transport factor 2 family protein [Chthoniobacterales bacterium]
MTKYRAFFSIVAMLLTSILDGAAAEQPRTAAGDQTQVVEAMRSMFAALAAEDIPKLRTIFAPDFYAFEAGGRITGDALIDLMKKAHAAGKVYVWTVNDSEVHIDGETAWITYVNRGSIKDGSETKNVSWLESAILRKEDGNWRIHFLHSTRMP